MGRLRLSALAAVLACCAVVSLGASVEVESESSLWPTTLLEHTAMASGQFAPEGRNRLERLAQLQANQRKAQPLGARQDQTLFFGADNRRSFGEEDYGRATEPNAAKHFGVTQADQASIPLPSRANKDHPSPPRRGSRGSRRLRRPCGADHPCARGEGAGPHKPTPAPVPTPTLPPLPPAKKIDKKKAHNFGNPPPPAPSNMLPTPRTPSCGAACGAKNDNPFLARVPHGPMDEAALAVVGHEGKLLKKILKKLSNREGWLQAQKLWLSKAVEAAAHVREQLETAHHTRDQVAMDLEHLKHAQDAISLRYKANKLKWAFKDKKMTLEALKERFEALDHARADVSNQIQEAKTEVSILTNTLGSPSEQVQISPAELEDPLDFLKDVHPEE